MRKLKTALKATLTVFCLFLTMNGFGQAISTRLFGENAWMPDTIGTTFYNGKLHQHWGNVQGSGAEMIRFGGIGPDHHMPTNHQYIKMVDSIRTRGMEPMLQVPFNNWQFTATQAAAIVQYVNIVMGKNVKYWVIGNEPNLGYSYTTAAQVAAYIKPFATAMKAIDPTILIVGPELAWFDQPIIDGLTTPGGPNDITGKDINNRYYIDVFSYHTYPFNGSQSRADVISYLTAANHLKDNLIYLNNRIAACNTYHARTGSAALKTGVTEMNINWQNPSSDGLSGLGASSFIGGQFVAEMFGLGMKYGVDMMQIWSVIEGNSTATNIGYLDRSTGAKKPLYYHYQLLAQNMNGTFANGTSTVSNVKTFGSKNGSEIKVMIMNQDLSANYNYTVRLNTASVSGSNPLKITVDAGVAVEYSDNITNQTSLLLTFDASGTLIRKCVYSLAGNATAGLPPTCTDMTGVQAPVANFSGNPTQICRGGSVAFTDLSTNNPTSWSWTFEGGTPATSTQQNPVITYNNAGLYYVTLTASNSGGSNTLTRTGYIKVKGRPNTPGNIIGPTTELGPEGTGTAVYDIAAVEDATTYTWITPDNATIVGGQNTTSLTLNFNEGFSTGDLIVTAENSCGSSEPMTLELRGVSDTTSEVGIAENTGNSGNVFEMNVYPNPTDGKFSLTINTEKFERKDFEVSVMNNVGQVVYTAKVDFADGKQDIVLRDDLVSGTYLVRVKQGDKAETKRLMIVH
jgi:PKD repeat protein